MSEAVTGMQRGIKRMRIIRAVAALAVALNAFIFAVDLSTGSPLVFLPPACIVALLVLIVMQTRLIGAMQRTRGLNRQAEELELAAQAVRAKLASCAHSNAQPVDLLLTGERVAWICPDCNAELPAGWTPQATGTGGGGGGEYTTPVRSVALSPLEAEAERKRYRRTCECRAEDRSIVQVRVPESATALASYCSACGRATGTLTATGSVTLSGTAALSGSGTLSAESPQAACDCGQCDDATREFDEQLREQIIASQGIPPAQVPERLTDSEVKDATEAAVHFAQLARVGRESCASPCRLCEARDQLYPTPESRALLAAKLAAFKDDESLRQWIETERRGGTRSRAPMTGPGGRWHPVSELPEMRQADDRTATEGIPAGPLIENMRQELEAQREVTSPEPPAGSYDFHFDSAGREWCRDTGMRCWIRPVPDGPWYRQNKSGGGEQ
jgi:hypothetical protein